jgi:hypothetical protein
MIIFKTEEQRGSRKSWSPRPESLSRSSNEALAVASSEYMTRGITRTIIVKYTNRQLHHVLISDEHAATVCQVLLCLSFQIREKDKSSKSSGRHFANVSRLELQLAPEDSGEQRRETGSRSFN